MAAKKQILVEVSNRHVHLSRKDIDALFGKNYRLKIARELSQPGQFAAKESVTLINQGGKIEKVRILGPERAETQVELSKTDALALNLNPPLRDSGDLKNSPGITIQGRKGAVRLEKGVILAKKHLHISEQQAKEWGLKDKQLICVKINEKVLDNISVRVDPHYRLALHLDKDEAKIARIDKTAEGELVNG